MPATECEPWLLYVSPFAEDEASPREIRFAENDEPFFNRHPQLTALTGVRKVSPIFAAWVRSYFAFCELRAVRPFPAHGRIVIHRSSVFRVGLTFPNYVSYVKKVFFFLNEDAACDTPAVRNVAKASKLSGNPNIRFPNFLRIPQAISILYHKGAKAEFGLLAYAAYLFSLRVHSEALPMRSAFPNDCMGDFLPHQEKASIVVRGAPPNESLILRLASRKNLPAGRIPRRPCFCTLTKVDAHALCPVHFSGLRYGGVSVRASFFSRALPAGMSTISCAIS